MSPGEARARRWIASLLDCNGFTPAEREQRLAKASALAHKYGVRAEYEQLRTPEDAGRAARDYHSRRAKGWRPPEPPRMTPEQYDQLRVKLMLEIIQRLQDARRVARSRARRAARGERPARAGGF